MIIIDDLQAAKSALTRPALSGFSDFSPAVQGRLREIFGVDIDPESAVRKIIFEVRDRGDAAILDYTCRIDRLELTSLEVDRRQITRAYDEVSEELLSALKLAAERISAFHKMQKREMWDRAGKQDLGWLVRPLQRIGVYAPGGTASYPSTVLMTAILAKVAGVAEVIMVTPPGLQGEIPPSTLVAADIAGVDRVFCVGGAQAIAALAYGTESIPRVDKICGPGNIFVVLAKRQVYGIVDIDGLQGPSEVLVVADETADPGLCAANMLAQAEHDALASAVMIAASQQLAYDVESEVERQLEGLSRRAIIEESLDERGMIVVVGTVDEAIEMANLYAPEHLCLMVDQAMTYLDKIRNAGMVFTGHRATVVMGDYVAGPSHVLPTGGTARFSSPLNVGSFLKLVNLVNLEDSVIKQLGRAASVIARAEGLDAHAQAVERLLE